MLKNNIKLLELQQEWKRKQELELFKEEYLPPLGTLYYLDIIYEK
jgi:hypothetical protein